MIKLTLKQSANITEGEVFGKDVTFDAIVTDTKKITLGCLFIALEGIRFDAHNFVGEAKLAGAGALLVNRRLNIDLSQLVVSDTRLALYKLAFWIRQQVPTRMIALTGSSGKTSVKEMTASILNQCGHTLYTMGNLNNDIGVPITLLRLNKKHKYAVIELGANRQGEIFRTTNLARPEVALVNNLSAAHLEGFGSLQGVAKAKGEIYTGLLKNGTAVFNTDSHDWYNWRKIIGTRKIWRFSLYSTNSDFFALNIHMTLRGTKFILKTPVGKTEIFLPLIGYHSIANALASAALAISVDIPLKAIKSGLANVKAIPGRLFPISLTKNQLLLDDSYNANVGSVISSMKTLSQMPGYRVMIIGDIAELGDNSQNYHVQIGKIAKTIGINHILSIGKMSMYISQVSGIGEHFEKKSALITRLKILLKEYSTMTIVVKGSRNSTMEDIIYALQENRIC